MSYIDLHKKIKIAIAMQSKTLKNTIKLFIFMQLKEKLEILEKDTKFSDWKKKNEKSYLAHIFRMFDKANENIWQFGYYNSDDTITTFILENDEVKEIPEQEIFKKDKKVLDPINLEKIKISFEDAVETAKRIQQEKYKQHPIMKTIAILQKLNSQVFNITFVTKTFGTLNIHVDSEDGKLVSDKFTSLMDIAKFEKGQADNKDTEYIG